jgi:DNA-binding response OmpR family regulator
MYPDVEVNNMIHILIVEDEKPISNLIRMTLKRAGYACDCAFDGTDALNALEKQSYDLILLDIMLPQIDGFSLMEYIRPMGVPVIFITAMNAVMDRVKGLRMGAEDYIVKPFEILELLARVEGVLRRHGKLETTITVGGVQINTMAMTVLRDGEEILLTKKEYDIALLFARNPGIVLYKSTIYERIWGGEYPESTRTVELHVQRMKKKLGWETALKPVYAIGYRLEV